MGTSIEKTKPLTGKVNILLYLLAAFILKILGWHYENDLPKNKRFVLIFAPHTSNWDGPLVVLFSLWSRIRGNWMAKHGVFRGPLDPILRAIGGFPVHRGKMNHFVKHLVTLFEEHDAFIIGLAPEATRKKIDHWKSGFYQIAYQARVPVIMTYLDYKRKTCGVSEPFMLTGDVESDLAFIDAFYAKIAPRHEERRTPVTFRNNARFQKSLAASIAPVQPGKEDIA